MKKFLLISAAVAILGIVLFLYTSFNGNFISKMIAKNTVEDYLQQELPKDSYQVETQGYNFKDDSYMFNVRYTQGEQSWRYNISVGPALIPNEVKYSNLYYEDLDEARTEQWNEEGTAYVKSLFEQLEWIEEAGYSIEVPIAYSAQSWQPQLDLPFTKIVSIDVVYSKQTTKEMLAQAKEIQDILENSELQYDDAYIMVTEEMDNRDGKKEGYAPIYYEDRFRVDFQPGQVLTVEDVRE